jgi:translation initiation factor IF-3
LQKPYINNYIRAKEVRVIDETGKQLGVLNIFEAIELAKSKGLDLIQVTEKVEPPVCRIMEYGKYLYHLQKKEKDAKHHKAGEVKGIRLTFGISDHDLDVRAHQAEKFLKEGNNIRLEMVLRGREKALTNFAREKINKFLDMLRKLIPIKIESQIKREFRGLTMIVSHDKSIKQ